MSIDPPLTLPVAIVPPPDLVRRYTSLDLADRLHLERLMASWSLLADFSFSDLLLFVPITGDKGAVGEAAPDFEARFLEEKPFEKPPSGLAPSPEGASGPATGADATPDGPTRVLGAEGDEAGHDERAGLEEPGAENLGAFIVLGQIRPTTSQTLYEVDLVGQVQSAQKLPNIVEAYRTGTIVRGEQASDVAEGLVRITHIPVSHGGRVLGVLCRIWSPGTTRRRGTLERVYLELFERLSVMVTDGLFPFVDDDAAVEEAPRVGDGVLVVDARERITYASPNAVNALHRASITSAIVGSSLALLGLDTSAVDEAFSSQLPVIEEVERRPDVILMIRCIPLIARGELTGAAVLIRDVTDLRRRDRLLLTKDATIREVHHRVKNNLQTISSLLRLQARRLDADEAQGRIALLEAERRIRAIAVVHDILAREATEQVPFDEIVPSLVEMIRETNTIPFPVTIEVDGGLGAVAAEVATPLAVAVAELLQNAMEHAFPEPQLGQASPAGALGDDAAAYGPVAIGRVTTGSEQSGQPATPGSAARVDLVLRERQEGLEIVVQDNGRGLPADFDIDETRSLGLSIVRDLIRTQLGGTIRMETDGGTIVRLDIPTRRRAT
jgi:two-component system, sensor histidine kinase PdtaS